LRGVRGIHGNVPQASPVPVLAGCPCIDGRDRNDTRRIRDEPLPIGRLRQVGPHVAVAHRAQPVPFRFVTENPIRIQHVHLQGVQPACRWMRPEVGCVAGDALRSPEELPHLFQAQRVIREFPDGAAAGNSFFQGKLSPEARFWELDVTSILRRDPGFVTRHRDPPAPRAH
jgi:hypothetical protein